MKHWIKKQLDERFFILEADKELNALNLAMSNLLDLVILDSQFQECDPFELCMELRKINPIVPILYMTGRLKKSYLDTALEAGVTDFLSDGLDSDELEVRIATAKKAVAAREKTAGLSSLIKKPSQELSHSLFNARLVLNEKALKLLEKTPAALLVIRLDQYEELIAQEGLLEPDQLLSLLSNRLAKHLKAEDLLVPSSEGRFLLLLPNANLELAQKKAEELCKSVEQTPFSWHEKKISLTISVAVGLCDANVEQYKRLASSAGRALKEAETLHSFITTIGHQK